MRSGVPLQSLVVLGVATVAIAGFYGVSHTVASERQALAQTRTQLIATRADIRRLKTELGTRASLRQLERWNAEVLGLEVPSASQFVTDAGALASLDRAGVKPGLSGGPPIMVEAMRRPDELAQAGPIPMPAAARGSSPVRSDVSVSQSVLARRKERTAMMAEERARAKTVALAQAKPRVAAPVTPAGRADPAPPARTDVANAAPKTPVARAERLAAMERRLADAVGTDR